MVATSASGTNPPIAEFDERHKMGFVFSRRRYSRRVRDANCPRF
jgi:hypothetical protein